MGTNKSTRKQSRRSLKAGRPPLSQKKTTALSAEATRGLIRSHHQLHKELSKAESSGDLALAKSLRLQIESSGGIESYQQASILGQSKDRGGDSSIVLMEWLNSMLVALKKCKPKLLEVGALSTTNACSHAFDVTHIDLHSQAAGILQQDFMKRPLPQSEKERFNIISLSLVLNYVPDAYQRGQMLRHCQHFLASTTPTGLLMQDNLAMPALFIVLPRPCLDNSRYMTRERFGSIMNSLGFNMLREKQSAKLIYSLWHLTNDRKQTAFPKLEVNPGSSRNNFTIVLDIS